MRATISATWRLAASMPRSRVDDEVGLAAFFGVRRLAGENRFELRLGHARSLEHAATLFVCVTGDDDDTVDLAFAAGLE